MALIQINRSNSDPSIPLNPGELFLNLANGNLWGGLTAGNELLLSPVGNASLWIGTTPPSTPAFGALWWDSVGGQLYVWYTDANSSQWVPASNTAGLADAPSDGNLYGRENGVWTNVNAAGSSADNVGRNKLHNPLFNIWQRGVGPINGVVGAWTYTADRWRVLAQAAGDAAAASTYALTDVDHAAIGDEEGTAALSAAVTGGSGATNRVILSQPIENIRRLSGKTVILSGWALSTVAGNRLGIILWQYFGTGGSPSPDVKTPPQTVTLSTTWQRFALTFNVPSAAGKTFGTSGNDTTDVDMYLSAGANYAAEAGIGVQSGTFRLRGVQLEIAQPGQTQPSPVEKPDPRYDLANCQRFYRTAALYSAVYSASNGGAVANSWCPVTMRAAPTGTLTGLNYTNASGASVAGTWADQALVTYTVTTAGLGYVTGTINLSADL
jgi:hypothetical protein